MTGTMCDRTRTRSAVVNPPSVNDAGASSAHDGNGTNSQFRERDSVSRLSEDLEPIHIGTPNHLPNQPHQAPMEIDALGVHLKDAISTINQLEGLGLQKLQIPLPKIIVLGEQSTGKSSVIEAISGIKTPRSTGTCTRCPLFIRLEPAQVSSGYKACVTLRRNFYYDGKAGRGRRFPGWVPLPEPQTVEFMSTDDSEQLEKIIARAQQATVSPLTDHREFTKDSMLHLDLGRDHQCQFSPNIVCITISRPGLPPLSFYDLPGIIGQAEDPHEVKFVKDLVTDYVKDPEALLLVTCSMENDIANSTAGGIARQLKATDRCIGVLTKPDRLLPAVCSEVLREIFDSNRFAYKHGYFVVRNAGQEQLTKRLTHDQARDQERDFFRHKEPFATEFKKHESRYGTWNLQAFLSRKLGEQIIKNLPIIQAEIESRFREVEDNLKQYPEPPSHNALRIIFDLILEFSQDVRQEVEGNWPRKDWYNDWEGLQKAFFSSLTSLKPALITRGKQDEGIYHTSLNAGRSVNDSIVVDEDDNAKTDEDVRMSETPETPRKKRKMGATPGSSPLKTSLAVSKGSGSTPAKAPNSTVAKVPVADFSELKTKFQLDEVTDYLHERSNARVPGSLDYRVTAEMTLQTLQNWPLSIKDFFNKLEQLLWSHLKALFDKHFERWTGTGVFDAAWKIVTGMVNLNLEQQRDTMAEESLNDETNGMYIFHDELYKRDKEAVLECYREARYKSRLNTYKNERMQQIGKAMSPAEEARILKDEKLNTLLRYEPYKDELEVVANITTYNTIAARRLHSSICMRIESKFFKQLRTQLRDELENGLGIHDESNGQRNAVHLLTQDLQRENLRQALLAQRNALLQGQQILQDLQQKKYGDETMSQPSSASTAGDDGQGSFRMPTPLSEGMDEV